MFTVSIMLITIERRTDMNREERPIVFTVSRITRNFGGLYHIRTKDSRADGYTDYMDIGVMELFDIMEEIAESFNDKGYAVLFEVD